MSKKNIALFVTATGKYIQFIPRLLTTAETFFLPGCTKTYYVFTDHDGQIPGTENVPNIVRIQTEHRKWPLSSQMRALDYSNFLKETPGVLQQNSHCFAIDADAYFASECGEEILAESVAVQHCAYVNRIGPHEENEQSTCYVPDLLRTKYYAGGFYGGESEKFLTINMEVIDRILHEIWLGRTPKWHDESALNAHFAMFPPALVLSPSFHWPEWGPSAMLNPYVLDLWNMEADYIKETYGHAPPFKAVIRLIDKHKDSPDGAEKLRSL